MEGVRPSLAFGVNAVVTPPFADVQVAGGLSNPTLMAIAPDGRIFVSEQAGSVRIIKNGVLLGTSFVNLNANSSGERGALGIAFDPAFASNQFVYVYYTSSSGPHNRVSRFTASGDVASGGETVILDLPTLGATNHNGGAIHFGPDGKLYVAVGENANGSNSQSMSTPLGKMLRINSDGSIPSDNPFFGTTTGINRAIWALGLRNPFTFAFQPGTGRLFINDVGEGTWEEIDDGLAGANYGWPASEGNTSNPAFKSPFYTYNHNIGACAITGGDFYNPATVMFPAGYVGDYFFADLCGGFIKSIDLTTKTVTDLASGISSPTDVQIGNDGALYYVARGSGSIRKITYAGSVAPSISQQPADQSVSEGASATFSVVASGTAPLTYQWQRNQANITGATSASYTVTNAQLTDNGAKFRCVVTNSVSSATSNEATLTVTANPNHPPTAAITSPAAGSPFQGGQTINYAGSGNDVEDGVLPAAAFTWEVLFRGGNQQFQPFFGPVSGAKTGSFTIPTQGDTSPNILYRIYLTVTDSKGASHKDSVDILPKTVSVTLATNPTGLQLNLDGAPGAAPRTFTGVVGIQRTIGAPSPQTSGGKTWQFVSWSDGGAASHTISTPAAATTYTATFTQVTTSQIYEAEAAELSGPVVSALNGGYTGTGYVVYANPSGDFVRWTVNVTTERDYSLDFRYALGSTTARSLSIFVNGKLVKANVPFAPTGAGTTWNVVTVKARLKLGVNHLRAEATGTGGPNLDNLVLR